MSPVWMSFFVEDMSQKNLDITYNILYILIIKIFV